MLFRAKVNYALARSMEQQREQQLPRGSRARCSAAGSPVNGRPPAEIEAHTPPPLNGVQLAGARKARQIAGTTTRLKKRRGVLVDTPWAAGKRVSPNGDQRRVSRLQAHEPVIATVSEGRDAPSKYGINACLSTELYTKKWTHCRARVALPAPVCVQCDSINDSVCSMHTVRTPFLHCQVRSLSGQTPAPKTATTYNLQGLSAAITSMMLLAAEAAPLHYGSASVRTYEISRSHKEDRTRDGGCAGIVLWWVFCTDE